MPKILPDDEIAKGKNSLNSKKREVFNVIHTWANNYVKYDRHNVEPIHIFLSDSGGTRKPHLVKVINNAISKILLYHFEDPENPRVFLLGTTGISAVNIGGTTIHSGLGIKPGTKLLGLNDKSKAALRNRLSEVQSLIIDEISLVSSHLWTYIDSRLGEKFTITEITFAGLSVMTVADLLQLPPEENLYFLNFLIRIVRNIY